MVRHACSKPPMMVCTPSSETESFAKSFWKLISAMLASFVFLDSHAKMKGFSSSCSRQQEPVQPQCRDYLLLSLEPISASFALSL